MSRSPAELFTEIYEAFRTGAPTTLEGPGGETFLSGVFRPVTDRKVIETALALVNMRTWEDFVPLYSAIQRGVTMTYSTDEESLPSMIRTFTDPIIGKQWQDLHRDIFAEYRAEGELLHPMIEQISKSPRAARRALTPYVNNVMKDRVVVVSFPEFRDGHLQREAFPFLPSAKATGAYGIAMLLDSSPPENDKRPFNERLRQCAYGREEYVDSPCGNWFLAYAGAGGGPLRKYCSDKCSRNAVTLATNFRVSHHRAKRRGQYKVKGNIK